MNKIKGCSTLLSDDSTKYKKKHHRNIKGQLGKPTNVSKTTRLDRTEYKSFFKQLDGVLNKYGYLMSRRNSIKETNNDNQLKTKVKEDFHFRLRTLYNKPLTQVKRNKPKMYESKEAYVKVAEQNKTQLCR